MHLLLVEDDPRLADLVARLLGGERHVVERATTGAAALELAAGPGIDAIVLDVGLPDLSGFEVARALRDRGSEVPILMLTARDTVGDRVSGLDAGADDYLVKPFDVEELRARLRALRRGRGAGDRRELGDWVFTPASQALYSPADGRIALTQVETELLELLTSSPEHVFTRDEILDSVFPGGSATTVDTYVHYIRRKSTPEIIETVRARGYRSGEPR